MIGYKLFRVRKDGSLGPLFINRTQVIPVGEWLEAETHPRSGYALRTGWHAASTPNAPHLTKPSKKASKDNRTWFKVKLEQVTRYNRPEEQGGAWLVGQRMKVLEAL